MRHRTPPKPPDHANPAAWQRTATRLERHCPDFPLAHEVAYRLADHHAAALPIGWESVPVMTTAPRPTGTAMSGDAEYITSHTDTEGER